MRYYVLATDFDGTLAADGRVDQETITALKRVRESGRKLILATGRHIDDLLRVFPEIHLFDYVVVENGALLYRPDTREEKALGDSPSDAFVRRLREQEVTPLSVGRVVVSTWEPHGPTVLEAIRDLGLELQVIFNKGAVMVLPSGMNKGTGLKAALEEMNISPHNVVGIGDAENDHSFLNACECSVAVDNALPMLKKEVDLITSGARGAGVVELIDRLVTSDLADLEPRLTRHEILVGERQDGQEVRVKPYGVNMLVAGLSGSGKSTFAIAFMEHLMERGYQFCIIDPEGDYQSFEGAVVLGDAERPPLAEEALEILEDPGQNVAVNLLAISLENRPAFFETLLSDLLELRARTGRPHWIVIDETHHLLPESWEPARMTIPDDLYGMLMITVHPDHVSQTVLSSIDVLIAIGESPGQAIHEFSETLGQSPPSLPSLELAAGEAIGWWRRPETDPFWFRTASPESRHRRHRRKYAQGDLSPDRSFYFHGPEEKLNLRANNLTRFVELAEGVDDATWMYHLRQGDYSHWFRTIIKDQELVAAAERVEGMEEVSAEKSREMIKAKIQERYTAPA
jgi:hypothetical protein